MMAFQTDRESPSLESLIATRSNSSLPAASLRQKWQEAFTLFRWGLTDDSGPEIFDSIFQQLEDYRSTYERLTARSFAQARVLEIGFGARPNRLIALMSMGMNVRGVDLDLPMLRFSPVRLLQILKRNGPERALKTGVRSLLFDHRERAILRTALQRRGYNMQIDPARFLEGDAATCDYGPEPLDLVYSEEVFEHIPRSGLETLVARLAEQVSPHGLLLITPNIFTGITGGHLLEWYLHAVTEYTPKRSEPWEHLRKRRFTANCYLNGLSRADYRDLFGGHFHILEENVIEPDLGRNWLTPEVKAELAQWSEDELLSNSVRFVLRPKADRS